MGACWRCDRLERNMCSGATFKSQTWEMSTAMYSFQALPTWRTNAINTQHPRAKNVQIEATRKLKPFLLQLRSALPPRPSARKHMSEPADTNVDMVPMIWRSLPTRRLHGLAQCACAATVKCSSIDGLLWSRTQGEQKQWLEILGILHDPRLLNRLTCSHH